MTLLPLVRVWSIDLAEPAWSRLDVSIWLDAQECERASRFVQEKDASRFIASHAAMRWVLARECGCRPEDVTYTFNPWGKPLLSGGPEFSLSHSGDKALLAVAEQPVGVDIEIDMPSLTAAWFDPVWSTAERKRACHSSFDCARLLAIWRRKEAVVKAFGTGLSQPLTDVVVPLQREIEPSGRWSLLKTLSAIHAFHCRELNLDGTTGCVATRSVSRLELHSLAPPSSRASYCLG